MRAVGPRFAEFTAGVDVLHEARLVDVESSAAGRGVFGVEGVAATGAVDAVGC